MDVSRLKTARFVEYVHKKEGKKFQEESRRDSRSLLKKRRLRRSTAVVEQQSLSPGSTRLPSILLPISTPL